MTRQSVTRLTLTAAQLQQWKTDGYLIAPTLFDSQQIEELKTTLQNIADKGEPVSGWEPSPVSKQNNILSRYPRFMHPHRTIELAKKMLLDQRVCEVLTQLIGEKPCACQSMYYFKPPGSKGQALHQDNFYLDVEPQTCIAAWTAIDPVMPENGGLYVVPGTHRLDTQCPELAREQESFTTHLVDVPKGLKAIPTHMHPGDVLFFNGQLIHGSGMNQSQTQWRRSLICHYMPRSSRCVNEAYFPILDFNGNELTYETSQAGGVCGEEWAEKPSSYQY
ncbi:MAG: phytanoyl-CoA dioxygenase family protein [Phycisphaeraceae bacterium]|nr:phytanoyl-CoA dioxygenase family protein [Phycisphaeraceae bacterium]